jgi:hypothetical protein
MMVGEIGQPKATNKLAKTAEANRVRRATHVINEWDEDMSSKTSPTRRRGAAPQSRYQWCQELKGLRSYRTRSWSACLLHIRPFLTPVRAPSFSKVRQQQLGETTTLPFARIRAKLFRRSLILRDQAKPIWFSHSHVLHCSQTAHARDSSNSRRCRAHHGSICAPRAMGGACGCIGLYNPVHDPPVLTI